MKILLIGLLVSSTTFAGTIVPDIQWNKIAQNQTGSAAAFNGRNNVTGLVSTSKSTEDDSSSTHSSDYSVLANKTFGATVVEARLNEYKDSGDYTNYMNTDIGRLINSSLSVGGGFRHSKSGNSELNEFTLSTTKKLKNLYLGGGIKRATSTFPSIDISYNTYFAGIGFMDKKATAAEVVLTYRPEAEYNYDNFNFEFVQDESTKLELSGTHTLGKFQIVATVSHEMTEAKADLQDSEGTATSLSVSGEFMLNKMFAISSSVYQRKTEDEDHLDSDNDSTSEVRGLSLSGRVNFRAFQVITTVSNYTSEYKDDEDEEDQSLSLAATYFF